GPRCQEEVVPGASAPEALEIRTGVSQTHRPYRSPISVSLTTAHPGPPSGRPGPTDIRIPDNCTSGPPARRVGPGKSASKAPHLEAGTGRIGKKAAESGGRS